MTVVAAQPVLAQTQPSAEQAGAAPAKVEMTTPTFEMFRMAPGKTESFIRSMALYDQVSIAGGQPATQLFLHSGGEGWDVLLYKPARPRPTPAQEAAIEAKLKEMGLETGSMYFLKIREQMADHTHFEASGPTTAAAWLADLDRQRAQAKRSK
jgi:hypothetical protein